MNELTRVESSLSVVDNINKNEISAQVSTAKQFPRNEELAIKKARVAAMNNATACFYSLPRGGKNITGASIRLAEIIAREWGNLRCGARIIDVGDTTVTAQAVAWDLETNMQIYSEVTRKILDKFGNRYNEDMIVITQNAAKSIALRNAIIKIIPQAYWSDILDDCIGKSKGTISDLDTNIKKMIDAFKKIGVEQNDILKHLSKSSVKEIDQDDLVTLRGLYTSIQEGTSSEDDIKAHTTKQQQQQEKSQEQQPEASEGLHTVRKRGRPPLKKQETQEEQKESEASLWGMGQPEIIEAGVEGLLKKLNDVKNEDQLAVIIDEINTNDKAWKSYTKKEQDQIIDAVTVAQGKFEER